MADFVSTLFRNLSDSTDLVSKARAPIAVSTVHDETDGNDEIEMLLFRLIDWWPLRAGQSLERMYDALLTMNRHVSNGQRANLYWPILEPLIPLLDKPFDPSAPEIVDFERAVMNFRDPSMPDPDGPHILLTTPRWPLRVRCPRFHLFEAEFEVTENMVFPGPGFDVRENVHRARPFVCSHCSRQLSFTTDQLNALLRLPRQ